MKMYCTMNVPFLFVLVVCIVQSLTEGQPLDGAHGNDIIYNEFVNENIDKGEYSYRFKTIDETEKDETAYFNEDGDLVVVGYYSYVDPEGKIHYVPYRADKTGFHIEKISSGSFNLPNAIVASLLGG
ncbi:larval cuticle protein 16/17 [Bombyx mori]|uniref:Cuticle protein n=1 Tax=Bombyx mori TaxID=7091 RepID=A0A8R1WKP4_BOMMO|nr:larval cuticle protein 16/17 [Bombyx mori]